AKASDATTNDGVGGLFEIGGAHSKNIEIELPKTYASLKNEEIEGINEMFKIESKSTVSLERKNNNKVYLKAKSPKSFRQLARAISNRPPTEKREGEGGGGGAGIALAAGILGIIGFVLAF